MVEIKSAQVQRFLAQPDASARMLLLAGRDRGRVKEASKAIQTHWLGGNADPLGVQVFHASEWRPNPNLVLEALLSPSLLGGQRVVRVVDADKAITKTMEQWLEVCEQAKDAIVVLEADDLAKSDSLRKLANSAKQAASLFFYADEHRDVSALIRDVLTDGHGLRVSRDASDLLQQSLGGDRAISRGELEKLALYVGDEPEVTLEHVQAVVCDASGLEFEALIHATSLGDFHTIDDEYHRLIEAGENPNTILALIRNHFAKLYELRVLMDGGLNFSNASSQMRPPLFWKSRPKFESAMGRWTEEKLHAARSRLLDAFVDVRTTGRPENETTERLLFALASLSRSR